MGALGNGCYLICHAVCTDQKRHPTKWTRAAYEAETDNEAWRAWTLEKTGFLEGYDCLRLLLLRDGIVWGCGSGIWPSYLRSGEDQGDSSKSFLMGAMLLARPVPDAQRRWRARRVFSKWEGLQPSFMMIKHDTATKKRRHLYEQNL